MCKDIYRVITRKKRTNLFLSRDLKIVVYGKRLVGYKNKIIDREITRFHKIFAYSCLWERTV